MRLTWATATWTDSQQLCARRLRSLGRVCCAVPRGLASHPSERGGRPGPGGQDGRRCCRAQPVVPCWAGHDLSDARARQEVQNAGAVPEPVSASWVDTGPGWPRAPERPSAVPSGGASQQGFRTGWVDVTVTPERGHEWLSTALLGTVGSPHEPAHCHLGAGSFHFSEALSSVKLCCGVFGVVTPAASVAC